MPYLAWRIPFLSRLNFNANALRWPPHSSSCFDIILHFVCVCVCAGLLFLRESEKRSVCTTVHYCALHLLDVKCGAIEHCVAPVLCRFLGGISRCVERGKEWAGPGVSVRRDECSRNWGVLLKPPLQIRGAERGSKWLVLCGWCKTLKSQSHLQHSLHQVH